MNDNVYDLTLLVYFGSMLIIRKNGLISLQKKFVIVSFSIFIQSQFNYLLRFQIAFESSETFFNCQKICYLAKKVKEVINTVRCGCCQCCSMQSKARQIKVKLHQQEMEKNSWLNSQSILKILNLNFVVCFDQCWTNLFGSKTCFCPLPAWLSW